MLEDRKKYGEMLHKMQEAKMKSPMPLLELQKGIS
jgi:hypothetical protein